MTWLLDTHVVLWWLAGDTRLSPRASEILSEPTNRLLWSLASSHEIAVKIAVGKLAFDRSLTEFYAALRTEVGLEWLPISHAHCVSLAELPLHHRDPFDRMLVAQARVENAVLVTADSKLAAYDVAIDW